MDISETVTALKAHLYEKVTSPLWGAFAFSWSLWNYRFIMVLLSSEPVKVKFEYIDATLHYSDWMTILLYGVVFPACSTILLIYAYPIPAKKVFEYWRKQQIAMKEIQKTIDDEKPMTREEEKELRTSMVEQELSFSKERSEREAEVKRLREAVASLQAQLEQRPVAPGQIVPEFASVPQWYSGAKSTGAVKTIDDVKSFDDLRSIDDLDEGEAVEPLDNHLTAVMRVCAVANGRTNVAALSKALNLSPVRAESYAEKLVGKKLLYSTGSGENGTDFMLTPEGREWIVQNNLDRQVPA